MWSRSQVASSSAGQFQELNQAQNKLAAPKLNMLIIIGRDYLTSELILISSMTLNHSLLLFFVLFCFRPQHPSKALQYLSRLPRSESEIKTLLVPAGCQIYLMFNKAKGIGFLKRTVAVCWPATSD